MTAERRALEPVVAALGRHAAARPDRIAIISGEERVTYGELWARVRAAALRLRREGVGSGDRVLLAAASEPAFAYGYFATHLAGATAAILDPRAPPTRLEELAARVVPRLIFGSRADRHSTLGEVHAIGEFMARTPDVAAPDLPWPSLDGTADLIFTTGTTGRPKAVRLTHRNVATAVRHINSLMRPASDPQDVEVVPLPLYHSFGLGRLRCNIVAGATTVLIDGFRLPGEVFAAIEDHGATGFVAVPAGFALLLRFASRGLAGLASRLRYVEIGSAPMPLDHKQKLMELLPSTELWMHYGLTEASRSTFIEFHRHRAHLESVGLAAPGVRLSVRAEDGSTLARGAQGVLWVGGEHVSPGYLDDPALTARAFDDGWVRTGDLAHIDAEGFVHLHGRHDDLINVGGYNVAPEEVERVLEAHPGIQEAACVGAPDPRGIAGSIVRAHLVSAPGHARPSEVEVARWLAGRLEPYKLPAQVVWVDALPRTASGKLQRAALR